MSGQAAPSSPRLPLFEASSSSSFTFSSPFSEPFSVPFTNNPSASTPKEAQDNSQDTQDTQNNNNNNNSQDTQNNSSQTPHPPDQDTLKNLFGSLCKQQLLGEVDKLKAALEKDNPDPRQVIMSIPMLLALTICPAMLGTQEAIRQSQSKNKREEHRARRCNLAVSCVKASIRSRDINNKLIVLKDNKLYIANEHPLYNHDAKNNVSKGYSFSGYFLPYPDSSYEGLVSTISDDPPILNWIYVDKKTYEVKYGVRADAQDNITGPFDCTKQDRRLSLEGWEGFCAVEELPGIWSLYYDRDDNGLKSKVPMGTRVLEVELTRREKKEPKPEVDDKAPVTIDEKWKAHKEETAQADKDKEAAYASAETNESAAPAKSSQSQPSTVPMALPFPLPVTIPVPAGDEEKAKQINEAMRRMSMGHHSNAESHVTNDNYSVWSAARGGNKTGGEGDGNDSATAASSVFDRKDDSGSVSGSDAGSYKKPYVEDAQK